MAVKVKVITLLLYIGAALMGGIKIVDGGYTSASYGAVEDTEDVVSVSKTASEEVMFRRSDGTIILLRLNP